jgi:tetratricopeptide repeat protein
MKKAAFGSLASMCLLAGVLSAQNPKPKPFGPKPTPRMEPKLARPGPLEWDDFDADDLEFRLGIMQPQIDAEVARAKDQMEKALADSRLKLDLNIPLQELNTEIANNFAFNKNFSFAPAIQGFDLESSSGDRAYREGTRAIDHHDYDKAIGAMDRVIAAKGPHKEGAYYWKAFAQSRIGRTNDALATLSALRKDDPQSRWLNDAKALEVEIKQNAGQHVSPDEESDEDLKLLAINGLMNSDPSRALPLLEKVLNDTKNPPRVRERALFVLARSNAPEAQSAVLRIAKGGGNPDLQMKALQYLAVGDGKNVVSALSEAYSSAKDVPIKRAALEGLFTAKARDQIASIARSERNPDLRRQAIQFLGPLGAEDVLLSLYNSEANAETKRSILDALFASGDAKQIIALSRRENDPAIRREAVQRLSVMKSKEASDYLMELLNK